MHWWDRVCNVLKWFGIVMILLGTPLLFFGLFSILTFQYSAWFSFVLASPLILFLVLVMVSGKRIDLGELCETPGLDE